MQQATTWFNALLVLLVLASPGHAQIDIAGDWDQPNPNRLPPESFHEDALDRSEGPELGDYGGLPVTEAARFKAVHYDPSWLSVPEHQCLPHPAPYQWRSPGGLSIVREFDPVTQRNVAYRIYGSYGLPRIVWMDDRPHPPANARHTYEGFSTGTWQGGTLFVRTTHLKAGFVRRNGVPHSDRAEMHEYFLRHDSTLTVVQAVFDSMYFEEPLVRSVDYRLNENANQQLLEFGGFVDGGTAPNFYKCAPVDEIDTGRWRVPHYLPGDTPELRRYSVKHGVPFEAAVGGAQTMYPEYVERIRALRREQPQP